MKVIHVFSINSGGAAIAAKRIAKATEKFDCSSVHNQYLVLYPGEEDADVMPYFKHYSSLLFVKFIRKLIEILVEPRTKSYPGPFSMGKFGVVKKKKLKNIFKEVDIIHIHWINRGFFSIAQLERLIDLGIPVVWTMHDMWAFSGGCHYDGECQKYKTECNSCSCVISGKDCFTYEQNEKKRIFSKENIYFVGCSKWITECAKNSYVLSRQKNIECIPNPIGNIYFEDSNFDVAILRDKYNVPKEKKVVLFGAMTSNDERKGGKYIEHIILNIEKLGFHMVVFGNCVDFPNYNSSNLTILGTISDMQQMTEIYAMSDVFIAPSIQENLANTVLESLASGTPVVAFNIGGMPDMIIDKENGRLVEPFQIEKFIDAIKYTVQHPEMRERAKKSIKDKFSTDKIGEQYIKLYMKAIENNNMN